MSTLSFKGAAHFRQRIVCALLSQKRLKIDQIRLDDQVPGISDAEANFLRLIDKITNGTQIFINETGTQVKMKPGALQGGTGIFHDCSSDRSIGYILEALVVLAPFCKKDLSITLTGITNGGSDLSVDLINKVTIPLIKSFGVPDINLDIKRRGPFPLGGGQVIFRCGIVHELQSLQLVDAGQVRRIRGVAYTSKVSPQLGSRLIQSAKEVLMKFTQDIFVYSDHETIKENAKDKSPGYGLILVAETTTGAAYSADVQASSFAQPEDLGKEAAQVLLSEVSKGGCVDSYHQWFCFLFMALSEESISKLRLGRLTEYSIGFLRILKDVFGVTFKLDVDEETDTVLCTVRGLGLKNIAKRSY